MNKRIFSLMLATLMLLGTSVYAEKKQENETEEPSAERLIYDTLWNEVSFPILLIFLIFSNAFVNVGLSFLHNLLYLYITSLMTLFASTII